MKKGHWLILLLIDLSFVYFMPKEIVYAGSTFLNFTFILLLILFLTPYLIFKTLHAFYPKKSWPIIVAIGSIMVVGPTATIYQSYRETSALIDRGIWTTGVITEKYESTRRHSKGYEITYVFTTDKGTQRRIGVSDAENQFQIGDSLDIIYLPEFPRINRTDFEFN